MYEDAQQNNGQNSQPYNVYPQFPASNIQPVNIGSYSLAKPEVNPLDRLLNQPSYPMDPSYQQQFAPRMGYGHVNPYGDYPPMPKPDRGSEHYMGYLKRAISDEQRQEAEIV